MSKKLAAKASLIQLPPATPLVSAMPGTPGKPTTPATPGGAGASSAPPAASPTGAAPAAGGMPRAKTAPGSMAVFMVSQSAAVKEAEALRERLKAFDGAKPVHALDAQNVRPSRWANRHPHSFADPAFEALKADIASAGGNVQPVSVRPVQAPGGSAAAPEPATYELVYGHRRHRACLELGLPVQAMVVEMDDRALFETMERENRARKNLSAWEQGMMYRRALDEGLYPSQRKLAESLDVDVALVSKSLSLARLPDAVVAAFNSPLEIQFRWARPLAEALQKDPDGVLQRAASIRQEMPDRPSSAVLAALTGQSQPGVLNRSAPRHGVVEGEGGREARWLRDARGGFALKFTAGSLSEADQTELLAQVGRLLAKR